MADSKPDSAGKHESVADPDQQTRNETEADESVGMSRIDIPSGAESTVVIDGTDISRAPPLDAVSLGPAISLPADGTDDVSASVNFAGLTAGAVVGDFQIRRVLGKGAFGTVYLALQLSLNRHVALKVTGDLGHEGRRMARLEHPNIVQVYSEQILVDQRIRLLSMQYVAGPTLQTALRQLDKPGQNTRWSGSALLQTIDLNSGTPGAVHPGAVHPDDYTIRVALQHMDHQQAVCLLAAELAHGLEFAHAENVLHRDIKPANVLLNSAGRPLLVDFNLAEVTGEQGPEQGLMGGTPAYMSPEHLRAFEYAGRAVIPVGPSADIYSLAVVVIQMLTGKIPVPDSESGTPAPPGQALSVTQLRRQRRKNLHVPFHNPTTSQRTLQAVIERATDPEPERRTESARLFGDELTSCRRLRRIETRPVMQRSVLQIAARHPILLFATLAILPQAVASIVNITYNAVRVPELTTTTEDGAARLISAFKTVTVWYNLVVWPLGIAMGIRLVRRTFSGIRMDPCATPNEERVQRNAIVRLPYDFLLIAAVGWLPGIIVFPLGLWLLADVDPVEAFTHFTLNFATSGLLAVTYSFLGLSWMLTSVGWLRHWRFPALFGRQAVIDELHHFQRPLQTARIAAALVPLLSAILLIAATRAQISVRQFDLVRVLLVILIVLGMLGPLLANRIVSRILERLRIYANEQD